MKTIDKYLTDANNQYEDFDNVSPIDTKAFKAFFREYSNAMTNANNKLLKNFETWIRQNNVNDKDTPDDVKQWVRDDMDEYGNLDVPEYIMRKIYNLVDL